MLTDPSWRDFTVFTLTRPSGTLCHPMGEGSIRPHPPTRMRGHPHSPFGRKPKHGMG